MSIVFSIFLLFLKPQKQNESKNERKMLTKVEIYVIILSYETERKRMDLSW